MKILSILDANPALCALSVAGISGLVSIAIAVCGWCWTLHVSRVSQNAETNRMIGFHKLEIYENAIEEINYLVPLYRQLWSDSFEKRSPSELYEALSSLKESINAIIEYQKNHNALGKAKVYSEALKDYVPFISNPACIEYIRKLDSIEERGQKTTSFDSNEKEGRVTEMYLLDELSKYEECAEKLREEIERMDMFKR